MDGIDHATGSKMISQIECDDIWSPLVGVPDDPTVYVNMRRDMDWLKLTPHASEEVDRLLRQVQIRSMFATMMCSMFGLVWESAAPSTMYIERQNRIL